MTLLTDFLAGRAPDDEGRWIDEIRAKPVSWLEARHDFIQWLFPLPEVSGANPGAPVLSEAEARRIAGDPTLQDSLLVSTDALMRLYGIVRQGTEFARGADFPGPYDHWLGPADHNHLRLTRVLRCLALTGLGPVAEGLRRLLFEIAGAEALGAWSFCLRYWRDAGSLPAGWSSIP